MNRKQKVAVVVGALLIAGLALFPPWRIGTDPVKLRWVGAPRVILSYEPVRELRWMDTGQRVPDFDRHNIELQPGTGPRAAEWVQVRTRPLTAATSVDSVCLRCLVVAALALTVAAVLVLKERKTG